MNERPRGRQGLTREEFLKLSAGATALGCLMPKALFAQTGKRSPSLSTPELEFRILGRTGLKLTTVSAGRCSEPVVTKALEMGINYFDTSDDYGEEEQMLGRVLKGKRANVHIGTKILPKSKDLIGDGLSKSLNRLNTDYVDLYFLHAVRRPDEVKDEICIAKLLQVKKSGKTRFIGVSTHQNVASVLHAAVEAEVYDVAMIKYNAYAQQDDVRKAISRAANAGVGIIAIKTQVPIDPPIAGYTNHQSALMWALDDPNVTCAIPGMKKFRQLEENFAVMGKRLPLDERQRIERVAKLNAPRYCSGCVACAGTCPRDVDIPSVRRCALYLFDHGDKAFARDNYLQVAKNASHCADCSICTARCVNGASLQPILAEIHRQLA